MVVKSQDKPVDEKLPSEKVTPDEGKGTALAEKSKEGVDTLSGVTAKGKGGVGLQEDPVMKDAQSQVAMQIKAGPTPGTTSQSGRPRKGVHGSTTNMSLPVGEDGCVPLLTPMRRREGILPVAATKGGLMNFWQWQQMFVMYAFEKGNNNVLNFEKKYRLSELADFWPSLSQVEKGAIGLVLASNKLKVDRPAEVIQ